MSVLFLGFSGELKTNQIELTSQSVIAWYSIRVASHETLALSIDSLVILSTYRVGRTDESHCNFSDPTNL